MATSASEGVAAERSAIDSHASATSGGTSQHSSTRSLAVAIRQLGHVTTRRSALAHDRVQHHALPELEHDTQGAAEQLGVGLVGGLLGVEAAANRRRRAVFGSQARHLLAHDVGATTAHPRRAPRPSASVDLPCPARLRRAPMRPAPGEGAGLRGGAIARAAGWAVSSPWPTRDGSDLGPNRAPGTRCSSRPGSPDGARRRTRRTS